MAIRPFVDTLRDLRAGRTLDELANQLNEVVAAVRDTGKAGKITITLSVKPASKGDVDTIMIDDVVKVSAPTADRGTTIFFATPENNLQRQHPNQKSIPFEGIDGGRGADQQASARSAS